LHFSARRVAADEPGLDPDEGSVPLPGGDRAAVFRHLPVRRADALDDFVASVLHLRLAAHVVGRVSIGAALTVGPSAEKLLVACLAVCLTLGGVAEVVLAADGVRNLSGAVETRIGLVVDPFEVRGQRR